MSTAGNKRLAEGAVTNAPGAYIHVPFCKTKCPYCDFYSVTTPSGIDRWLDCLARETGLYTCGSAVTVRCSRNSPAWREASAPGNNTFSHFDTLYLGGGTPSVLNGIEISRLMTVITDSFSIAGDAEITIEVNPDDVTPRKLAVYRDLGINRISLGVQSFSDDELRFLGRRHDARAALSAIDEIRTAGFNNIGIDLIYGFEDQSLASWERSLRLALELSPEHISCYQMTIEPGTAFGRMQAAGALSETNEELQRRFFLNTAEILRSNGYIHYEISNFAREERYIARHNSKYWRRAPYLGLGPAAHSFKDNKRWWNVRSVADYCQALEDGRQPVAGSELLRPEQIALETIALGFRTRSGVALDCLHSIRNAEPTLVRLESESLIELTNDHAVPTLKGYLIANELPLAFI